MREPQETEITLGTGRLLGIFFALVAICSLFFALGYSLGKSSGGGSGAGVVTLPEPPSAAQEARPSPLKTDSAVPASSELTFYKAVEERTPDADLTAESARPLEAPLDLSRGGAPTGYVVQVAAVSKQEDAEALQNTLRQKQYPVFVLGNSPTDRLFRVQVGPFQSLEEAEAARARLVGDGYNPILRK
jgi:DedD protein